MSMIILLVCFISIVGVSSESMARGFNDDIDWVDEESGFQKIQSDKPRMVLIHKTWCGACKQLKPKFTSSNEIVRLSKEFVMINVQDDEEEKLNEAFSALGKYIPRIFFTDSKGNVQADLKNAEGSEKYPYFYSEEEHVVKGMKNALNSLRESGGKLGGEL